ncbi:cutinase [Colletotrichum tabaci]|uniref:cutinase n=1 Tax=Colletotrichum tabaci TaxID=1209068 RepID=A0AAV9T6X2_9PEZI
MLLAPRNIRHVGIVLGALVLHSATFVYGLSASTNEVASIGQDTPAMDLSDFELRQDAQAQSFGINTTRDDLARKVACADITVVFAHGTTEPGNVSLVTGPPFFDALKEQLGGRSVAIQGVEYPATFAGFNRNGTEGVPSMS